MPSSLYNADLAYIHDAGFSAPVEAAAQWILDRLRSHGIESSLVVDLGCGSGVLARALTDAGYDALGIDYSPAMLRLARRAAPRARFRRASLFRAALPRCAAVVSVGECVNYLADRTGSLDKTFGRIARALEPGGRFIFDFANLERGADAQPFHRMEKDWAVTVDYRRDSGRRLLERRITTFRQVGRNYRRNEENHRVRLLSPTETIRQVRAAGFRARFFSGYAEPFPKGLSGIDAVRY